MAPKRLAVFASGSGSNAEKIAEYFAANPEVDVTLILSNNPQAGVIARARRFHIPVVLFDRKAFYETHKIIEILQNEGIDLVVLAGFMMLIPEAMVQAFPNKIINIHPALLPKYGGKGMYGHFVHEAVVAAQDLESGITVHFVNERYDEGDIIFQATCPVTSDDTPEEVARKVQILEHQHYPEIVKQVLSRLDG